MDTQVVPEPTELDLGERARWLSDQLGLEAMVADAGARSDVVYTVDGGAVTAIVTGGAFATSDGRHLVVNRSTPATERTEVLSLEGTLLCEVPAAGGTVVSADPSRFVIESGVQTSSPNQRLVYYHRYDFNCSTGEVLDIVPALLVPPGGDAWQESYTLFRVADREFLGKKVANSLPTTNEAGVRIDGRDQTSRHEFSRDGALLVHVTTTLLEPTTSRLQARDTVSGELLWESLTSDTILNVVIAGSRVLVSISDPSGAKRVAVLHIETGRMALVVQTSLRLVAASP